FSDPLDGGSNFFSAVKVVSLPGAGTLRYNGVTISAGQEVTAAEPAAGALTFLPAPAASGAGYSPFSFPVRGDGGTANSGSDLSSAHTMTISVTAVAD